MSNKYDSVKDLLRKTSQTLAVRVHVEEKTGAVSVHPELRNELFRELREQGYGIRKVKKAHGGGWYAKLRTDVFERKGKCAHCDALIDMHGIWAHGRDCEVCGKPICREFVDGGEVEIEFRGEAQIYTGARRITMRIKRFDPDARDKDIGDLVLYAEPLEPYSGLCLPRAKARDYLAEHEARNIIGRRTEEGHDVIFFRYKRGHSIDVLVGEPRGQIRNAKTVKIYRGREYAEYGDPIPVPEGITIREV